MWETLLCISAVGSVLFTEGRAASYFSPLGTSCKSEALEEVGNVAGNKDLLLFFSFTFELDIMFPEQLLEHRGHRTKVP